MEHANNVLLGVKIAFQINFVRFVNLDIINSNLVWIMGHMDLMFHVELATKILVIINV
jgi:hypothetical protein